MTEFVVTDESHAEHCAVYSSFEAALAELKRRSAIPWDQEPNRCPCTSWETCDRDYHILEYDDSVTPNRVVFRVAVLNMSANGVVWNDAYKEK